MIELIELIIAGKKTATCRLVWSLEAEQEPGAEVGDIEIVLSYFGRPVAVTRVLDPYVVPFDEVTAEHAALEGEGDLSLAYWRQAHWEFFSRECERIGRTPDLRMPFECFVFEVVEVVPAG